MGPPLLLLRPIDCCVRCSEICCSLLCRLLCDTNRLHGLQVVGSLQGNVVDTHRDNVIFVVATDDANNVAEPLRAKLMHAMCTSSTIVSREWADASAQKGAFLPTEPFKIQALEAAQQRGNIAHAEGGLFAGCLFYVHQSVPGKTGNPKKENLLALFGITGGTKMDAAGIGKMVKKGKNLSKMIIMAPGGFKLPEKVSEALLQGAKAYASDYTCLK